MHTLALRPSSQPGESPRFASGAGTAVEAWRFSATKRLFH